MGNPRIFPHSPVEIGIEDRSSATRVNAVFWVLSDFSERFGEFLYHRNKLKLLRLHHLGVLLRLREKVFPSNVVRFSLKAFKAPENAQNGVVVSYPPKRRCTIHNGATDGF